MVSSRGGKYGFVYKSRQRAYKGIRKSPATKTKSAKIANAGRTHEQRSRMSKKAWRTRKARRGGRSGRRS